MFNRIRLLVKFPTAVWLMVISHLPGQIGYGLRHRYWKARLKKLGDGAIIDPGVYFQNPEYISIDDHAWIDRGVIILAGIDTSTREKIVLKNDNYKGDPGDVYIGKYVHVAPNCMISGVSGGVYISDFCGLSANCKIYAFSHHYRSVNNPENRMIHFTPMCPQEEQCLIQGAVQIGENTGMALNVVILPGVSIPRNCFVAINSVVGRGKYSENTIISGDPAASGKPRFRPDA